MNNKATGKIFFQDTLKQTQVYTRNNQLPFLHVVIIAKRIRRSL